MVETLEHKGKKLNQFVAPLGYGVVRVTNRRMQYRIICRTCVVKKGAGTDPDIFWSTRRGARPDECWSLPEVKTKWAEHLARWHKD